MKKIPIGLVSGIVGSALIIAVPTIIYFAQTSEVTVFKQTSICPNPQPIDKDISHQCRQFVQGKVQKLDWNGKEDNPENPSAEFETLGNTVMVANLPETTEGKELWKKLRASKESRVIMQLWRGQVVQVYAFEQDTPTLASPDFRDKNNLDGIGIAGLVVMIGWLSAGALQVRRKAVKRRKVRPRRRKVSPQR